MQSLFHRWGGVMYLAGVALLLTAWPGAAIVLAADEQKADAVAENSAEPEKPVKKEKVAKKKKEKAPAEEGTKFMRVLRDEEKNPQALQTAVVRYTAKGKKPRLQVDLIGAVHVAEGEYYDKINDLFKVYEVVLYELVAPEENAVPKPGQRSGNPIGMMQGGLTSLLELTFQLDGVDYTAENLVHADMTPEQFAQSMKDRDETPMKMFFRMMGYSMSQQAKAGNQTNDMAILGALFAKDRALRMRRIMAEQFEATEGSLQAMEGPKGSTLVTGRNEKAFEVLQEQIDQGRRRIAIFYGAGHMPDMEKRLIEKYGMKKTKTTWLDAWDLTEPAESK